MQEILYRYFNAEKQESLLFIAVGVVAIGLSIYYGWWQRQLAWQGAAIPLVLVALIQLGVGGSVYQRTDRQVALLMLQYRQAPAEFKTAELQRMQVVRRNFVLYRYTEIGLACLGVLILLWLRHSPFWWGLGLGLAAQSVLMLALDYFAEARALVYTQALQQLAT